MASGNQLAFFDIWIEPEMFDCKLGSTIAVVCAAAAAVVLVLLTLCLGAYAVGPDAGKNAVASVGGPEIPWPGRIAQ